jgi:predicted dehydrogenase
MEKLRAAVCGFRHGHIGFIVKSLKEHPEIEITACSEEEPEKCSSYIKNCGVEITHNSLDAMLAGADFEILAMGDCYAKRGGQAIKAMEAGKHIFSDKPLCTAIDEIKKIKELSDGKKLSVIVALTLRYSPVLQTARKLIADGAVGEVANVIVTGQHSLQFRSGRPDWYFEKGMHGGIINDIMIHGIDAVPWLAGVRFSSVLSALTGHFEPPEAPDFQDIGKAFLKLENGGGVFLDASYKAPSGHPSSWGFSIWGTGGYMDFKTSGNITVRRHNKPEEKIEPEKIPGCGLADDLVNEIRRMPGHRAVLATEESLMSTLNTVRVQEAGDKGLSGAGLE